MVSAYLVASQDMRDPDVSADLEAVGIAVVGHGCADTMVQAVIRAAPDVVICYETHPDDAFFASIEALNQSAARPTVVFTGDPDAEKIDRATRAGIHAYVVNGYGLNRLRPTVHLAQSRFRHVEALRGELTSLQHRFSERKLVDQAKAILMRLRNLPEEDAYAALRSAAMKANKRMGQVARLVIDAARYGEAVNRAGQLRMISQRLVKLYALLCAEAVPEAARLFDETLARGDATLSNLGRSLSKATFGDLIDAVAAAWAALRAALKDPPAPGRLVAVDDLAEQVLAEAEQLTTTLESMGFPAALRVINVAGRQRMLTQRYAKQALLGALQSGASDRNSGKDSLAGIAKAYRLAMVYLDAVPLRTAATDLLFAEAAAAWGALEAAAPQAGTSEGRRALLDASEILLSNYDALTDSYERSLQSLMQA